MINFKLQLSNPTFTPSLINLLLQLGLWDPLGLIKPDAQGNARFEWFRTAELKHGRIAMLAVTGYLTTANGIRLPGMEQFPDGIAALGALADDLGTGRNVLAQTLLTMAVAEIAHQEAEYAGFKSEFIGDYRNGLDYGWDSFDDATKIKKRNIELNQGRAAMMGIWGLVTHEQMGVSILPGGYLPGH